MKKSSKLTVFLGFALAAAVVAFAQQTPIPETESTVPELIAFHDIIYPIWHTAYPDKDYAALRSYAPDVKSLAEKIYAARLPGILHEKEAKWNQGLSELRNAVDDYLKSAAGTDDEALLNAAEALHARYEMMVRIIRPVLKEVDDFHKVLYVIYHKDLPNKAYENIKAASGDLVLKSEAITKATLPRRLESQAEKFNLASAELLETSKALAETAKSEDGRAIEAAVEKVHTAYQNLEKVFE